MSGWIETVFFGFGSASGLGPEPPALNPTAERARRCKSTSAAYCAAIERGPVNLPEDTRQPMGFAIPKVEP